MEKIPEPIYSREKFNLLKQKYENSKLFYSKETKDFANYLREKYPNQDQYAFWHILGASSIDEMATGKSITHEDFPGDDSVEAFLDNPEKYKLG